MGKTILITGASSGIGKATAKLFHKRGWNVVATMRALEREDDLGALDGVLVTRLDVTDGASIRAAFSAAMARFGGIDALVNNAGYGAYGPLEATSIDTIRRQFDTNVIGLLETTKAVLPHFRSSAGGVVINISSMGGRIAFPLGALYHGTKFAVEGLSEALSYELAAIGARMKIVEPGLVKTDFGGRSFDFSNDETMAEYQGVVQKLFAGFGATQDAASEPALVAKTIHRAVTDGTDQLRYVVGKDAESFLSVRDDSNDPTFLKIIRDQFAL